MPSTVKQALTPDLQVSYEESGPANGEPVVLLHGWPYSLRSYDRVRDELADDGFRVIVPELRGFGATQYRSASVMRTAQQAALGKDIVDLLDALALPRAMLVGYDWGGRGACVAAALWPQRVTGLVTMQGYYILDRARVSTTPPKTAVAVRNSWYQWAMQIDPGVAALEAMRDDFARECWRTFSPTWTFSEEQFAEQAVSFHNPDWIATTVQQYRWRYGNADGSPELAALEDALSRTPPITVPTIAVVGDSDGMLAPEATQHQDRHYLASYERRLLAGVGHCPAMEAPADVAKAVKELQMQRAR